VAEASHAVFLSYASQDAVGAQRIGDALRSAGIEVFLDQSELRGGDVWDQKIRNEIHDCALFIPVISANTASRHEGYFRLEWDLADQRSHMMARNRVFIVPVCLDATRETGADVPESFHRVQWTRLPGGETSSAFVERVRRLLSPELLTTTPPPAVGVSGDLPAIRDTFRAPWRSKPVLLAIGAVVVSATLTYFVIDKPWISRHALVSQAVTSPGAVPATSGTVAEKSIAVLPFVNMSPDKDQEYFADGLAEELLDLLAKTPGLHVIARTSSFSFKGKSDDIPTIAAKLKVANILEGSIRKSGTHLRVTTQLVRATDGEHLWSETYDRELKDVFRVQDEIAEAVVTALKLKLSPAQGSSPSRSSNTDAYLQYLLGQQYFTRGGDDDYRRAAVAYRNAVALDPRYAAAYAGLVYAEGYLADTTGDSTALGRASLAADHAIELAPDQAAGYAARGYIRSTYDWNWTGARSDFAKALELDPNDPIAQVRYSALLTCVGRFSEAIAMARRAVELDPLAPRAWDLLGQSLIASGDRASSRDAFNHALTIDPAYPYALNDLAVLEIIERRPRDALVVLRRFVGDDMLSLTFRLTDIAMAEHSLGHAKESQHALDEAIAKAARTGAYQIAEAHAWRGETDKAFEWLERAYRQRDGGLGALKSDPLLPALRGDPRYKALLTKINLSE
jgi:TolB-like protein/lipoprotein NlpI